MGNHRYTTCGVLQGIKYRAQQKYQSNQGGGAQSLSPPPSPSPPPLEDQGNNMAHGMPAPTDQIWHTDWVQGNQQ
eukprot:897162-Ditylum_brightwellii.AAC.1